MEPWIALQSQLNQKKANKGGNLPHPVVTITVTGNFGGCDMSTWLCQAAYRNIMAAAKQMAQTALGNSHNPITPSKGQTWSQYWQATKACAASSFGLSTAAAGGAVASGLNVISTSGKFRGMTAGTSVASQFFRSILPQKIASTWAPTISDAFATSGTLGGVVGRWVPVIGEAVLIYQGAKFVACDWGSDDTPWVIGGSQ